MLDRFDLLRMGDGGGPRPRAPPRLHNFAGRPAELPIPRFVTTRRASPRLPAEAAGQGGTGRGDVARPAGEAGKVLARMPWRGALRQGRSAVALTRRVG